MNLIFCHTPLQVLIAERIIDLHPQEEFYGIMRTGPDNEKFRYYFGRLKRKCKGRGRYVYDAKPKEDQNAIELSEIRIAGARLSHLLLRYCLPKFDKLYVANLDLPILTVIIPKNPRLQVITFDDGIKNLSVKYNLSTEKTGRLGQLLGFSTEESLFARHKKHYSIFPYPNSMPNVEHISLYGGDRTAESSEGVREIVTILLGQPLYESEPLAEEEKEARYNSVAQTVLTQHAPQYYLPHPRETFRIEGMEYIDTSLIFEDYILNELKAHPEREYVIYTFCSTSILTLQGVPRLRFVVLKPSGHPLEYLQSTYDLLERLGIEIHHLDVAEAKS